MQHTSLQFLAVIVMPPDRNAGFHCGCQGAIVCKGGRALGTERILRRHAQSLPTLCLLPAKLAVAI